MATKVKPITPEEANNRAREDIPDEVIEAFNELIAKDIRNGHATVMQNEVEKLICSKLNVTNFDNRWLDIEYLFEKAGWIVTYDKPGYNETYEASYKFKVKKRGE